MGKDEIEGTYKERFEHIREAHRQQALDMVAKEKRIKELQDQVRSLKKESAGRAEFMRQSDTEWGEELDEAKEEYDALFREYARVCAVLAHLVDLEHDGEVTIYPSLTKLGMVLKAKDDWIKVRSIVVDQPAIEPDSDEEE